MLLFFSVAPQYQRLVHFRLGRCLGEKGPAFIFALFPIIDQVGEVKNGAVR